MEANMKKHFDNATRKKKTVVFQQHTKPPTNLQTMLKRPVYYFTTGRQLDQKKLRDVFSEKTPFWIPSDNEEFSYKVLNKLWKQQFREEERSYKYYDRPNYRSRQKVDILERLHIPEEEPPHVDAITDIDPNFFKIVQGRPIKERLDLCQYINDVRETLRVRLKTGYQQDEMLLLDEQFIEEQRRIDGINEQHKIYVDSFEEFLSKDHGESMSILKKSEECSKSLSEKDQEYKHLLRHLGLIRSRVYILEENWRNCKMYQKFLYRVSPLTWRVAHDYIHMEGNKLSNERSDVSLFGRYRLDSSESVASLNSLINMFEQDIDKHEEPHLYFTDPEELNKVFEDMEHQNLNSLLHLESLFGPLEDLRKEREQTEKKFENEVKSIHEKIAGLKRAITWEENRAEEMEKYSRDLMAGMFRDLVVSDHVLTLHVYVEDTYEAVISKNEGNLRLHEMMKAIEVREFSANNSSKVTCSLVCAVSHPRSSTSRIEISSVVRLGTERVTDDGEYPITPNLTS
uniref:DUF4200 domain-containing protein n=1 Tax=Timema cristinae TaxID=61476 RepID=A0A7R9DGP3_TIMCR|nr:unnamed protein product [Timema cristinae]